MKVLAFHGSRDEDSIRFTFEGAFDPRTAQESELQPFLQALLSAAQEILEIGRPRPHRLRA